MTGRRGGQAMEPGPRLGAPRGLWRISTLEKRSTIYAFEETTLAPWEGGWCGGEGRGREWPRRALGSRRQDGGRDGACAERGPVRAELGGRGPGLRMTLMVQAGAAVTPPPYAGWGRWGARTGRAGAAETQRPLSATVGSRCRLDFHRGTPGRLWAWRSEERPGSRVVTMSTDGVEVAQRACRERGRPELSRPVKKRKPSRGAGGGPREAWASRRRGGQRCRCRPRDRVGDV